MFWSKMVILYLKFGCYKETGLFFINIYIDLLPVSRTLYMCVYIPAEQK
jgi:hypothetical protein